MILLLLTRYHLAPFWVRLIPAILIYVLYVMFVVGNYESGCVSYCMNTPSIPGFADSTIPREVCGHIPGPIISDRNIINLSREIIDSNRPCMDLNVSRRIEESFVTYQGIDSKPYTMSAQREYRKDLRYLFDARFLNDLLRPIMEPYPSDRCSNGIRVYGPWNPINTGK